jgi:hypothetical protein
VNAETLDYGGVAVKPPTAWFQRREAVVLAWVIAVLLTPALYVIGGIWLGVMMLIAMRGGASQPSNTAGAMVGARVSYRLFRTARQLWPRRVAFSPQRPTVLFLRAFSDDGRRIERPIRFSDNIDLTSLEELVSKVVSDHANVIAIADPKGSFQPLGPDYIKCTDAEWKPAVSQWMKAASKIVVLVNTSDGVFWELTETLRSEYIHKAIFLFPGLSKPLGDVDEEAMAQRQKTFERAAAEAGRTITDGDPPEGFAIAIDWQTDKLVRHRVPIDEERSSPLPARTEYEAWLAAALSAKALTTGES